MRACIDRGVGRFKHARGSKYSEMSLDDQPSEAPATSLVRAVLPVYNTRSESKSFRAKRKEQRTASLLDPLRKSKIVTLTMESIPKIRIKTAAAGFEKRTVILTPGDLFGLPKESILVSVVGKGCTVFDPLRAANVSKLVLAGIPAMLANVLADEMRRALKEF